MSVCVVDGDLITAYGSGIPACWDGLMEERTSVKPLRRFSAEPFQCRVAACLDELTYRQGESIVWQMLSRLLKKNDPRIPDDAVVLLASTTGEIDLLEQAVDAGQTDCSESKLAVLLEKICSRLDGSTVGQASGIQEPGFSKMHPASSRIREGRLTIKKRTGAVISSACASATVALAQGAQRIDRGESDCVLVVAVDAVSEFVFSGFASLMALDPQGARPFDADREGLSVGEAAGFALLMSRERAEREQRKTLGALTGWGMSNDANHMTGPSRDGGALARAMRIALDRAQVPPEQISMICAHGTGTRYNDSMELNAFKQLFDSPVPLMSVKGGTGHTMGAAGLVETLLTLRALNTGMIPPAVALKQPDEPAHDWISCNAVSLPPGGRAVSTNSGFGGVNAALVLEGAS